MLQLRRPLTVNERILLHLADAGYQGGPNAPFEVSQHGLAEALHLRLSHTSRALKALIGDGLIVELVGRVPGEVRRRKVYALTPGGLALAQSLGSQVGEQVVLIVGNEGSTEMTLLEATRLPGGPHSLARLLTVLRSDGALHIADLVKGEERAGPVAFARGRPPVALLLGRTTEERTASHWVSAGTSVLAITGPDGIGKTAFASSILRSFHQPPHSFWYSFRGYDDRTDLLSSLGGFLGALGKSELAARGNITDRGLESLLARDLRDENVLFVLDDLDRAPRLQETLAAMVRGATAARTRVIATAREPPPWFQEYLPDEGLELALPGLALEDSLRLVPAGTNPEEARCLAELARGNPRVLSLAATAPDDGLEDLDPPSRALTKLLRARQRAGGTW